MPNYPVMFALRDTVLETDFSLASHCLDAL